MKRILIIEDDPLIANTYSTRFSSEGFEVMSAADGESGFELINSFHPDVVILDLMLPKLTGLELLKRIRSRSQSQRLPVIVFSNTYLSNLVQEAWKAGATKCLSKANCAPKQVINVVRSLFPQAPHLPFPTEQQSDNPTTRSLLSRADADDSEAGAQAEFRQNLTATLSVTLALARATLGALGRSSGEINCVNHLSELYGRVHVLTGNAGIAGLVQVGQMADALEALLKELHDKPGSLNASVLRTIASALDLLEVLIAHSVPVASQAVAAQFSDGILVVDGERASRAAIVSALDKANLPVFSGENPESALQILAERAFSLVILNTEMPGLNELDFYLKLRALRRHMATPVIFISPLSGFERMLHSLPDDGNDVIAKPFLQMELAVKALGHSLRTNQPRQQPTN